MDACEADGLILLWEEVVLREAVWAVVIWVQDTIYVHQEQWAEQRGHTQQVRCVLGCASVLSPYVPKGT